MLCNETFASSVRCSLTANKSLRQPDRARFKGWPGAMCFAAGALWGLWQAEAESLRNSYPNWMWLDTPKLPFRRAFTNHSRAQPEFGTGKCYHVFVRMFRAKGLHGNFRDCPAAEAQIETTLKGSWSCKLQGKLYKPFWARVGSWQSLTPTFREPSTNLPRTFRRFLAYKSEF